MTFAPSAPSIPDRLYTADDLLAGYEPSQPRSFADEWDFQQFRAYVRAGRDNPVSPVVRDGQALHDAAIADALARHLSQSTPKLVGIMGGHALTRSEHAYRAVASLARRLTAEGFTIVSGGGPGAMEAAHVGALFATCDTAPFDRALAELAKVPKAPDLSSFVAANGDIVASPDADKAIVDAAAWMDVALAVRAMAPSNPPDSLAIPTWRYGGEPTIPLATHYAKYFQNSIREEALVLNSRAGIIYARGGGGTVREIFEDAEQNYYARNPSAFTPMIFFDRDGYWEHNGATGASGRTGIKVKKFVKDLFRYAHRDNPTPYLQKILFTTDMDWIVETLKRHSGVAQQNLAAILTGADGDFMRRGLTPPI